VRGWDQGLWEVVTALGGGAALPEARCALEGLRMPVLFITGDDDRIVPTSETRKIAARLPGATLVVIPECGHLPQEERPDAFVQAVSSFVGR
jgi:pimeloyl-ACP methyl ester carboxylesterase